MSGDGSVLFYGDAHGEWTPLFRACERHRPEAVVLLGDCDLKRPLREQLRPVLAAGIRVRWIPGGGDASSADMHDRLWGDYPEGNLHARWDRLAGMVVAGLGGAFKPRCWFPRDDDAEPAHATRREFLRGLPQGDRWRGGLPLRLRAAIFPEDVEALRGARADVLVTHEAPSCHPRHGFVGVDMAANVTLARLVVHGRHHECISAHTPSGIPVRGLGRAEVFLLCAENLP